MILKLARVSRQRKFATKSVQNSVQIHIYDAYRSYVINYNHGKALVADYVERDGADADQRWARFKKLLSLPMQPKDLR